MQQVRPVENGFRNRPHKPYAAGTRYSKPRVIYYWKNNYYGRVALVILGLISSRQGQNSLVIDRKFKECGLTGAALKKELLEFMPWFEDHYIKETELPRLKEETVFHRVNKMYIENNVAKLSKEHYQNHPDLAPLIPAVDKFFVARKVLTKADCRAIIEGVK